MKKALQLGLPVIVMALVVWVAMTAHVPTTSAAPAWECVSLVVTTNQATKTAFITVTYSAQPNDLAEVLWDAGSNPLVTSTLHAVGSSVYLTTTSHTYASVGSYAIQVRVWNDIHTNFSPCTKGVVFNQPTSVVVSMVTATQQPSAQTEGFPPWLIVVGVFVIIFALALLGLSSGPRSR